MWSHITMIILTLKSGKLALLRKSQVVPMKKLKMFGQGTSFFKDWHGFGDDWGSEILKFCSTQKISITGHEATFGHFWSSMGFV